MMFVNSKRYFSGLCVPLCVLLLLSDKAFVAADADVPSAWPDFQAQLQNLGYSSVAGNLPARPPSLRPGDACTATCAVLKAVLQEDELISPAEVYWSTQQTLTIPKCRVRPKSAQTVAASLLITQFFKCPFAVKSGGHACFAGASNIEGGLTIDLAGLNGVNVSPDKTVTQTGAGNRWVDVYSQLDAQQLSVLGGRVADIGVGGLTLGGGISFFSGRYGWALDGVQNYQTVIANGSIVDVNEKSHSDLYFALRGGGNNFGIVTRFDLETFPQGNLWGGQRIYPITANTSLIPAFVDFSHTAPTDPDAALILNVAFALGQFIFDLDIEYAKPTPDPPIFAAITRVPSLTSSTRIASLADLTLELQSANPYGFRETYKTATFTFSKDSNLDKDKDTRLVSAIVNSFTDRVTSLNKTHAPIAGFIPALTLQPITTAMIQNFGRRGGNALGISDTSAPLLLMNLSFRWSSITDDPAITDTVNAIINNCIQIAAEMGMGNRYIYQNYASQDQDVFAGYGPESLARLRAVKAKYDPRGVFTNLQPGYFKIR